MTPTKTWKSIEAHLARMFATERTPLSGGNSKMTRSDTLHPRLFIEVKQRKFHAVAKLFRETKELAKKESHHCHACDGRGNTMVPLRDKTFIRVGDCPFCKGTGEVKGKIPVVVLHETGSHDYLVVCEVSDLKRIAEEVKE